MQEKKALQRKSLCTQLFKEEDIGMGISDIFKKCWVHLTSPFRDVLCCMLSYLKKKTGNTTHKIQTYALKL